MYGSSNLSCSLVSLQQAIANNQSFFQIINREFDTELSQLNNFQQNKQPQSFGGQALVQNQFLQMSQYKRPITGFNSIAKQKPYIGQFSDASHSRDSAASMSSGSLCNNMLNYDASINNFLSSSTSSIIIDSSSPNSCKIYSRKVFIGGLPPDIDEGKNKNQFFMCSFIPLFFYSLKK
jgi:hypothetical protein